MLLAEKLTHSITGSFINITGGQNHSQFYKNAFFSQLKILLSFCFNLMANWVKKLK